MVDTNYEDLQQLAQRTYNRDLNGALRIATGLRLDVNGICRRLFGKQKEAGDAYTELHQMLSNHALRLDGTSGCFVSTPDAAALDIVADIDMRIEFVDTGLDLLSNKGLIAKWSPAAQQSYRIAAVPLLGRWDTVWSATGANSLTASVSFPAGAQQVSALRTTIDVDNGASGRTIRVYSSPSLDGSWTQIGGDVVQATATSIFASTATLVLGTTSAAGTSDMFKGRITRAEVRAGINGTVVANPDFRALAPGTTSFADGTGKTWTLQGTARIV